MCSSVSNVFQHVIPCHHKKHSEEKLRVTHSEGLLRWLGAMRTKQKQQFTRAKQQQNSSSRHSSRVSKVTKVGIRPTPKTAHSAAVLQIIGINKHLRAYTLTLERYPAVMFKPRTWPEGCGEACGNHPIKTPSVTSVRPC